MAALKAYKESEQRLHDAFYEQVHLLTLTYKPNKLFHDVFKRNMFAKNNKEGFHQVTYYLINIIDPQQLKVKISTWPLTDITRENQFRSEVINYIKELNITYESANIPKIVKSQLISPGGFRFIKLMFSLSQLALFIHVKRHCSKKWNVLGPLLVCDDVSVTEEQIKKLRLHTRGIEKQTEQKMQFTNSIEKKALLEAQVVREKQSCITAINKKLETELHVLKQKSVAEKFDENKIQEEISEKFENLKLIKELFDKCKEINEYYKTGQSKLEYVNEDILPTKVHDLDGNLNLLSLLEVYKKLTEKKIFEIEPVSNDDLKNYIKSFEILYEKLDSINAEFDEMNQETSESKNVILSLISSNIKFKGKTQSTPNPGCDSIQSINMSPLTPARLQF